MAWYRVLSGSTGRKGTLNLRRIVEAYSAEDSQDNTVPRTSWDENDVDNNYVTYDETTHKWTVVQAFEGTVILAVRNWKISSSAPFQKFYYNNSEALNVVATGTSLGAYGVGMLTRSFPVGASFWTGKDGSAGWEAPYLLIVKGKLTDNLFNYNTIWQEG